MDADDAEGSAGASAGASPAEPSVNGGCVTVEANSSPEGVGCGRHGL